MSNRFAGVQFKRAEDTRAVVHSFMLAACQHGLEFQHLEVFGIFTVGSSKFIRFRTDCKDFTPIVARLLNENRGSITPDPKRGYLIRLPSGQEGVVEISKMLATPLSGYPLVFRGPKIKYWERQFEELKS